MRISEEYYYVEPKLILPNKSKAKKRISYMDELIDSMSGVNYTSYEQLEFILDEKIYTEPLRIQHAADKDQTDYQY